MSQLLTTRNSRGQEARSGTLKLSSSQKFLTVSFDFLPLLRSRAHPTPSRASVIRHKCPTLGSGRRPRLNPTNRKRLGTDAGTVCPLAERGEPVFACMQPAIYNCYISNRPRAADRFAKSFRSYPCTASVTHVPRRGDRCTRGT